MISAPRAGHITPRKPPGDRAEHSIRLTSFGTELLRAETAGAGIALDPLREVVGDASWQRKLYKRRP